MGAGGFIAPDNAARLPADHAKAIVVKGLAESVLNGDRPRADTLSLVLGGLGLDLKGFDQSGSDDLTSVGFAYSLKKSHNFHTFEPDAAAGPKHEGFDFNLSATGNVSFDRSKNVEDLLDTTVSFSYFLSKGGATRLSDEDMERYLDINDDVSGLNGPLTPERKKELWAEVDEIVASNMTDQLTFSAAGNIGLEADQSFDAQQWAFGAHAAFGYSAWSDGCQRNWVERCAGDIPKLAKWNILDWPFAAVRFLTGADESWRPRSRSLPVLLAGFDYVYPTKGDPRKEFGDDEGFARFRGEIAFRTPILDPTKLAATELLGVLDATVSYRIYQELGASSAVKAADLDLYQYVVATLSSGAGVFFSYSYGKLPFDANNDQIFQIGYQFFF